MNPITLNNKIIGYMDTKNSVYVSDRTREHIFNKYRGFGMSVKVLGLLQINNIENIIIRIEGFELVASVLDFYNHGIKYTDIEDKQLILPFEYFNKKPIKERQEIII